jgi:hypothetical protein
VPSVRRCNRDGRNHLISVAIVCSPLPLRREGLLSAS